ncbi:unnamed protein product [Amoebophrya sp. A25]|nr:unnamed protein product [Amoebophrya sp. A25]|eukprot:GSA25T00011867001.1
MAATAELRAKLEARAGVGEVWESLPQASSASSACGTVGHSLLASGGGAFAACRKGLTGISGTGPAAGTVAARREKIVFDDHGRPSRLSPRRLEAWRGDSRPDVESLHRGYHIGTQEYLRQLQLSGQHRVSPHRTRVGLRNREQRGAEVISGERLFPESSNVSRKHSLLGTSGSASSSTPIDIESRDKTSFLSGRQLRNQLLSRQQHIPSSVVDDAVSPPDGHGQLQGPSPSTSRPYCSQDTEMNRSINSSAASGLHVQHAPASHQHQHRLHGQHISSTRTILLEDENEHAERIVITPRDGKEHRSSCMNRYNACDIGEAICPGGEYFY